MKSTKLSNDRLHKLKYLKLRDHHRIKIGDRLQVTDLEDNPIFRMFNGKTGTVVAFMSASNREFVRFKFDEENLEAWFIIPYLKRI